MTVATFLQTDYATQTGTVYPLAIDADFAVASHIITCFAPHEAASPDMTVVLNAGSLFIPSSATLVTQPQQITGTITAPVTNPRIDRVVIDATTAVVSVITGAENVSPVAPALTVGVVPVAQVLLGTGTTAITNSLITDERTFLTLPPQRNTNLQLTVVSPANASYVILGHAAYAGTINSTYCFTDTGTLTAGIKIGVVSITGLAAVAVTSTGASTTATSNNVFAIGDLISMTLSASAGSPTRLSVTLNVTQT